MAPAVAPAAAAPVPSSVPAVSGPQPPEQPWSERPRRERLEGLLVEAIHQMDDDGLVFLLKQADVLRTNANAERIRREIEEYEAEHGIDLAPAAGGGEPELPPVSLETSSDGKAYILVMGKARKILTRAELGGIVEVCLKAADREGATRALYAALGRERSDILVDAKISSPVSPMLVSLYATILDLSRQARG